MWNIVNNVYLNIVQTVFINFLLNVSIRGWDDRQKNKENMVMKYELQSLYTQLQLVINII